MAEVDSLKALDPNRPIREADINTFLRGVLLSLKSRDCAVSINSR